MVSPQVVFLLEYKGGGGGVCIKYKQGTVENWLPMAANECICVCVGGCDGMGGGGVIRILKSLMGVINSIYYIKELKSSQPTPHVPSSWWIMTTSHLAIYSYIFFILLFYFIYLFIHFLITFFSLRESTRRNYFTWHIWGQFQSPFALHSFGWGSVSCCIVKWERSGSHLREG